MGSLIQPFTRSLLVLGLCCMPWVRAAEEPAPSDLLRRLSEQYYDLDRAGLSRASCFVESREILDQLDDTAKALLRKPDFEAILVPGKPVTVKVRDLPANYGPEARKGVAAYCLGATLVLDVVFGALDAIPDLLAPERVTAIYDVELAGRPGEWRIVLTSKATGDADGKRVPLRQRREARREGTEGDQPKERVTLTLDKNDRVQSIRKQTGKGVQETKVTCETAGSQWLISGLDIADYDEQERLFQRQVVAISYSRQNGIYLPTRVSSKAVDKEGHLLHRRDEADPVTIRFTQYRVERRE